MTVLLVCAACAQVNLEQHAGPTPGTRAAVPLSEIGPAPSLPQTAASRAAPSPAAESRLRIAERRYSEELWSEAIEEAERVLRISPDFPDAHLLIARAAMQSDNRALARQHVDAAAQLAPRDPRVHQVRGTLAWQEQDMPAAIQHFRTALLCDTSGDPSNPDRLLTHLYLGLALARQGYLNAAAGELETYVAAAESLTPEMRSHPEVRNTVVLFADKVHLQLGEIYEGLNQPAKAAESLGRAAAANPRDPDIKARRARALARSGQAEPAILTAREAAGALDPKAAIALVHEICELAGRANTAEQELRRLAQEPGRAELALVLARQWSAAGRIQDAADVLMQARRANPAELEIAYALAELRRQSKDWQAYLRELAAAIQIASDNYARGIWSVSQAGLSPEARREMLAAIARIDAGPAPAWSLEILRARLLELDGRADEATQTLEQLMRAGTRPDGRLDPQFGPASIMLAERRVAAHRWDDAIDLCRRTNEGGFDHPSLQLLLARALEAQERFDEAETAYRESWRLLRKEPTPLLKLAEMQLRQMRLPDMQLHITRAIQTYMTVIDEVDPRNLDAREGLVRAYLMGAGGQTGIPQLQRAAQQMNEMKSLGLSGPPLERADALVRLALADNNRNDALGRYQRVLEKLLEDQPDDLRSREDLAYLNLQQRRPREAIQQADAALAVDPEHPSAREFKVDALRMLLRWDEAHQLVQSYLAERPRSRHWRETLVEIATDRVDQQTAMDNLRVLMERDDLAPRRPAYERAFWEQLQGPDQSDELIAFARQRHEAAPDNPVWRIRYLTSLEMAGQYAEAARLSAKFLEDEPGSYEARQDYALRLVQSDQPDQAALTTLGWLEDDPEDGRLLSLLVHLLHFGKDYPQVIALMRALGAEMMPNYPVTLLEAHLNLEQYDDAMELVERRRKAEPEASVDHEVTVHVRAGRLEEAENAMVQAIEAERAKLRAVELERGEIEAIRLPGPARLVMLMERLASVYQRMGKRARADGLLREVYDMMPDDVGINNDLGYTWADAGVNLDQAVTMTRLAVSQQPRNASFLDSLGWALYKKGEFDEAAEWLRRARRWRRNDPLLLDHSGDIAFRLGRVEAARLFWSDVLKAGKDESAVADSPDDAKAVVAAAEKLKALEAGATPSVAPLAANAPATQPGK